MRFSEAWLRKLVNPNIDTLTMTAQLSMAGLEVGAVTPVAGSFTMVVVGKIQALIPHPSADKLRVCQVEINVDDGALPLQIVCGAANAAVGQRVPVALVGAVLPGEVRIQRAKLRGIESFGMICSAAELGLEEKSVGIFVLPTDAPVGQDLRAYLGLDDQVIEVELTPDRGDCWSLVGIAREVGVINRIPVTQVTAEPVTALIADHYEVSITAPWACPRYACRILRDLNPAAQTPLWLRERLRRGGIRAINPIVDVTNYVMLELGQPMHGFDLNSLDRHIEVRMARPGERLALLDGRDIALRDATLVIADATKPIALAGIMGGEPSSVSAATQDILLESAFFTPQAISGRSRIYGLATDSSQRFERGVDPGIQKLAIERATQLLLDIAGGKPGSIVDISYPEYLPKVPEIPLRRERIQRILGLTLSDAEVTDILSRLGMHVRPSVEGWLVLPPSHRFDISIEVDLIAELGRIHGYANIPTQRALVDTTLVPVPETCFDLDRAKDLLIARGYQEVVTYSFISAEIQELLNPGATTIALSNPLSPELAVMRSSLWPGLLLAARHSQARQSPRVRIFESGLGFIQDLGVLTQTPLLAGLATGSLLPEQWAAPTRLADFFDVKGDVEALLGLLHLGAITFAPAEHPALHPGQSARILRGSEAVGWIGVLHPRLQQQLDFPVELILFELSLPALKEGRLPTFHPLSKFPLTRRDIAIVIDRKVSSSRVLDCIRAGRQEILQDILLFDLYTDGLDIDKKSLAIGLVLQAFSHTLNDAEVNAIVADILRSLADKCGAVLRA